MATSQSFIEFVSEQLQHNWILTYKKMFGEYMVYINLKPLLLVCNDTVYVKKLPEMAQFFDEHQVGIPYKNGKEHYILDIEDRELSLQVVTLLYQLVPQPKPKKLKEKK